MSKRIEVYVQPRRCIQDGNHAGNHMALYLHDSYAIIFESKVERLLTKGFSGLGKRVVTRDAVLAECMAVLVPASMN